MAFAIGNSHNTSFPSNSKLYITRLKHDFSTINLENIDILENFILQKM